MLSVSKSSLGIELVGSSRFVLSLPGAARLLVFIATVVVRLLFFKANTKLGRGK